MNIYQKIKIVILSVFVLGFLYCFYGYCENGRYIFSNRKEGRPLIMDSRTGEIYSIYGRKKVSLDKYQSIK